MKNTTPEQAAADWALIDRYRETRSDRDFEAIVNEFTPRLKRYVLNRFPDEAQDVLQNVFAWLFQNVDTLKRERPVRATLYLYTKHYLYGGSYQERFERATIVFSRIGDEDFEFYGTTVSDPRQIQRELAFTVVVVVQKNQVVPVTVHNVTKDKATVAPPAPKPVRIIVPTSPAVPAAGLVNSTDTLEPPHAI